MANNEQIFGTLATSVQLNLDTVLREQIGLIPAVWLNTSAAQAAVGQTIQYPLQPDMTIVDASADCCDVPCPDADQTWNKAEMTITNDKAVRFCWNGEDDREINNSYGYSGSMFRGMQIEQAVRVLINAVERSVAAVAYNAGHVYTPVSGGVLFNQQSDNIKDITNIRKIMDRAAVPDVDRHLVLGFDASANIRNLYGLTRANENNSDTTLRTGRMLSMLNFDIHESFAVDEDNTAGTGAGYLVNNSGGYAAGAKAIVVDTGTGTILAGNRVSFAGNSDVYTVASYASNTITLIQGLTGAIADNAAVTVGAAYGAQIALQRRAIVLATRLPSIIGNQDRARNRTVITDPMSGLSMMLSQYDGYRATWYELALVWGVKMVKPEMAVLIPG